MKLDCRKYSQLNAGRRVKVEQLILVGELDGLGRDEVGEESPVTGGDVISKHINRRKLKNTHLE